VRFLKLHIYPGDVGVEIEWSGLILDLDKITAATVVDLVDIMGGKATGAATDPRLESAMMYM